MSKIIVWDLFGGGQNSVYNALKDDPSFEVHTFDITEPTRENHHKVDLTQENILDVMSQYPKPDIIVASPMCQSWSQVLSMKGGGTPCWLLNQDKTMVVRRTKEDFEAKKVLSGFTKNLKWETMIDRAIIGQKCIDNTISIIKHFQPTYWYIENPKQSLMWKYIELNRKDWYDPNHQFLNLAVYKNYGFPINKPTYFMSNTLLNLKSQMTKTEYEFFEKDGVKYKRLKYNPKMVAKASWGNTLALTGMGTNSDYIETKQVEFPADWRASAGGALASIVNKKQGAEQGARSHIPSNLIKDIFSKWKIEK